MSPSAAVALPLPSHTADVPEAWQPLLLALTPVPLPAPVAQVIPASIGVLLDQLLSALREPGQASSLLSVYGQQSRRQLGLDHLQDLLAHPSPSSWRKLSDLMPRFEG